MARIRTIKPEFWSDAKIARLDWFSRLLFIALWNFADDDGRGRMLPKEINGFAFPLDDVADRQIGTALTRLTELRLIRVYPVEGIPHFCIPSWEKHQVINRPTPSKIPPPPAEEIEYCPDISLSNHGGLSEVSTLEVEVGNGIGKGNGRRTLAPTSRENPREDRTQGKTCAVWSAYSEAYLRRYGEEPARNKSVNGILANYVDRIPADEAPAIAAFFVCHNKQEYVSSTHHVRLLLRDCEGLRTQWKTGMRVTNRQAAEADRLQGQGDIWREVGQSIAEKETTLNV